MVWQGLEIDEAFTQMLNALPECVKVLGTGGDIRFVNDYGLKMMEAESIEEVAGKHYPQLWPRERRSEILDALRLAANGKKATIRGHCPTLRGNDRCWETHLSRLSLS